MNKTLLTGLLIMAAMLAAALFGPYFAPYDLEHHLKITYVVNEQGKGDLLAPPLPPNETYPFGTDKNGYDLMTKLLYGAKYTLFLSIGIAFARVVIGGLAGMFLGYYGKTTEIRKNRFSAWNMLNGIPIFLMVWFVMVGITINPAASPFHLSIILAVVMVLVGLPSVASTLKEKTAAIRDRLYVTAARALGAGHWTIIRSHIFPHLKESFLILIVNEVILVLSLFGQLAVFNIFVGGTIMYYDPVEYHSRTNEWGGLIGQARNMLYVNQWILLFPLAFYVALIIGFQLISNGLETFYNKKYAKFTQL